MNYYTFSNYLIHLVIKKSNFYLLYLYDRRNISLGVVRKQYTKQQNQSFNSSGPVMV